MRWLALALISFWSLVFDESLDRDNRDMLDRNASKAKPKHVQYAFKNRDNEIVDVRLYYKCLDKFTWP